MIRPQFALRRISGLTAAVTLVLCSGCSNRPAPATDPDHPVDQLIRAYPGPVRVGIWVGEPLGTASLARNPTTSLATASAIKSAYLVELFAEFADGLDETLPGAEAIVSDPTHPAVAHFVAADQGAIHEQLGQATVREIGFAMMQSTLGPEGHKVSNAVYNGAANLVTAVLGGPKALTERIHTRYPESAAEKLMVRRYMLARRDSPAGDNTACAEGLAVVLGHIAAGTVPGVAPATNKAIRAVMSSPPVVRWDAHFRKGGSLDTTPQCRIRSGWVQNGDTVRVYAIMAEQPAGQVPVSTLAKLTEDLFELLVIAR